MFDRQGDGGYRRVADGIELRTRVYGRCTLMAEFRLAKGSTLPRHAHPHEQTGFLVSGRILLSVAGESHAAGPGDAWSIPGGVEHWADALEESVAIEVFSPVREDYLPAAESPAGQTRK